MLAVIISLAAFLLALLIVLAPRQTIPSSGPLRVESRTALAAQAATNLATGHPAFLEEAGRNGLFQWSTTDLSAKVTLDPSQCLYVAPASDTDGSSGAWVRTVQSPLDPAWCGTPLDGATDATAGLQAAIDLFKAPDLAGLPETPGVGASEFRVFAFAGRDIDLKGRLYAVGSPLNCDTAYGLGLENGTLLAIGASWTAGQAIIECLNSHKMHLRDLTLEGNQLANGIHLDRPRFAVLEDVRIFGVGLLQFGVKVSTKFGGLEMQLRNVSVYGQTGSAATTSPDLVPTATGFLITGGSDSSMIDCKTNRMLIGVQIETGGWRLIGNHFTGGLASRVGLKLTGSNQFVRVSENTFDHTYVHIIGSPRVEIENNTFYNIVDDAQPYAILWEANAPAQFMQNVLIRDNFAYLAGDESKFEFIRTLESGGNAFDGIAGTYVGGNAATGDSSYPTSLYAPRSTYGTIDVDVTLSDWRGNTTNVDLSDYILQPKPPTATPKLTVSGAAMPSSGEGAFFMGSSYDTTTGLLSLFWSRPFEGREAITYQWGDQYKRAVAVAPAR